MANLGLFLKTKCGYLTLKKLEYIYKIVNNTYSLIVINHCYWLIKHLDRMIKSSLSYNMQSLKLRCTLQMKAGALLQHFHFKEKFN